MATHSSVLAWRTPGTGGLPSLGSHRVGHYWSDLAAAALEHTRLPCLSPTSGACSNLCPLNRCCHPTVSSSVVPFSSCLQYFPGTGSFPVSYFFVSGGHSMSFSFSISPSNEYSSLISFRMDWLDLLPVQGTLRHFLPHSSSKASILRHSACHNHTWLLEKP